MCLSPIWIKNPTRDYRPIDKVRLQIPCGKCPQCQQQKAKDYEFRMLSDMYRKGRSFFFYTLTYNNQSLPYREFYTLDGEIKHYMCFVKDHIKTHINNIRKYLHKHFSFKGCSFFCVPEYGDLKKRVHWHVYFSTPVKFDAKKFLEIVNRFWNYGLVFPEHHYSYKTTRNRLCRGIEIKNPETSSYYIAHYVTDFSIIRDIPHVDKYLNGLLLDNDTKSYTLRPFVFMSKSLGDNEELRKDPDKLISYFKNGYITPFGKKLRVPLFIIRKTLFDIEYKDNGRKDKNNKPSLDVIYKLNSLGFKFYHENFGNMIKQKAEKLAHGFRCMKALRPQFFNIIEKKFDGSFEDKLCINFFNDKQIFTKFALYDTCFRDVKSQNFMFGVPQSVKDLFRISPDIYLQRKLQYKPLIGKSSPKYDVKETFSNYREFVFWDYCIDSFNSCSARTYSRSVFNLLEFDKKSQILDLNYVF
ncbi:replication initiator protein [Capybara microvirus Cap3_SP_315]|nr:replication initiator protein [Capybara microvirus Cap3_SP_315]